MGRKVNFEEKCKIVQWVLTMTMTTKGATIQFNVSYQACLPWVRKYHEAADSWEALKIIVASQATKSFRRDADRKKSDLEAEIKKTKENQSRNGA